MRLLLDTHIWAWSLLDPDKLGAKVLEALESTESELWLSPISTWEMLLLIERGRIVVDETPAKWVANAVGVMPCKEAPVTHQVALESRKLRFKHSDAADRFLAATAIIYGLTLVTADRRLLKSKSFPVMPNR